MNEMQKERPVGAFDNEGNAIDDGQTVRVNGEHIGVIHVAGSGKFTIDGWPDDQIVRALDVIKPLALNIDNIHPMIKE